MPPFARRLALATLTLLALSAAPALAGPPPGTPDDSGVPDAPYNCGGCTPPPVPWERRDSDGDGLLNGEEHAGRVGDRAFRPTDPQDEDTDSDGLSDGREVYESRVIPEPERKWGGPLRKERTDPTAWDTDRDGHSDGLEVLYTKTHPNLADTDRDGLTDGAEGFVHRTDARRADTDGDCRADGTEVAQGTDPRVADTISRVACGKRRSAAVVTRGS